MSEQYSLDHIDRIIEPSRGKKEKIIESIISAGSTSANGNADASVTHPPTSSTATIPKVPQTVRETEDYEKEYVPKVVSIGPYHFGNPKLQVVEKLKPFFTMKLLRNSDSTLRSLYDKLGDPQMVLVLRSFYEEHSTDMFCDEDFTKMMLLDSCFVLYSMYSMYLPFGELLELRGDDIYYIKRDLLLLENQIPFKVLREVMNLVDDGMDYYKMIKEFVYGSIFSLHREPPGLVKWLQSMFYCTRYEQRRVPDYYYDDDGYIDFNLRGIEFGHLLHLLHLLYIFVDRKVTIQCITIDRGSNYELCNFGTANELVDIGIQFKPSAIKSSYCIKFVKGCLELPPITIDDSTKAKWLNMIAYERAGLRDIAWIETYVCFLHSLIEQPEDVKVLKKAWVLGNYTGSNKDVVNLFKEIATGLVPNHYAYLGVKRKIQMHYESWRNTLFSQLKHEYLKSPWSYLALLGALIALFFSALQTYFTIWSPKSECDDLCKSLKMNHHL
ncbi:hypothetical protein SSX86_013373 [Deinandra increscens subsp. villosa]|uniref:Uncharacterized protein n=1 Tax=Deinandra increscens subsp. villosa TaxID=3103831 RepID=A0AAP0DB29_9ASTR